MQVTIESLSGLERKLNITVPVDRIENETQKKLHKLTATAKIAGFRPGKVPLAMIQKRYGDSVRGEVIENLIRETYVEAIQQEKLHPAGQPKIEIVSSKPGEPFSYVAILEIYPEVKLNDLSQIKVEKAVSKLTDDDVNEMLKKLQKERVQWKKITDLSRKSQAGDQIIIDFTAKAIDDPSAEAKKEENVKFVIGDGSMWEDFERQLYGVSAGEKKKYTLQFPPTHMDKELIGKDAEFEVEIREVCEPVLLPLDDKFAEKIGVKEGGLESLKAEVRKNMERELQTVLKNKFKQTIMDKLLESHSIGVPKVLVENELEQMHKRWQEHAAGGKKTLEKPPEFPRKDFEKQAQRSVSLGLLLSAVIKENKITVEQQELRSKIEELASVYDDASKVVDWYFSDQNRLMEINSILLEEKAIDYLTSKVDLIEKEMGYQDVVARK
jgi:trigger factor